MRSRFAFSALLFAAFSAAALAAPVSVHVTGTFDAAEDSLSGLLGKSFSLDLSYDTATSAESGGNPGDGYGIFDLASFSATVDGQSYELQSPVAYLESDSYGNYVSFNGTSSPQGMAGLLFNVGFNPASSFDTTALPGDLATFSDGSALSVEVRDITDGFEFGVNGDASTRRAAIVPQATPEPSAVLAMSLGAAVLVRRRRHSNGKD